LRPTAQRGELTGYAAALDDLWLGVAPSVALLERVAADPPRLLEDADLDGLRYSLHRAAELVHGLPAPAGALWSHAELAEALVAAREATGLVADALEEGGLAAAEPLVWEWRGALFNLRLARRRLEETGARPVLASSADDPRRAHRPAVAAGLVVTGVGLVLAGALLGAWLLWTVGIVIVLASLPLSGGGLAA
jgi:hypothetical protein